jgi:hypothetical protein
MCGFFSTVLGGIFAISITGIFGSVALLIKSRNFPGKELRPSNWTDFPR